MKKLIFTAALMICYTGLSENLEACSSIFLQTSEQAIYGRNHDYYNPNSVIIFNPKNIQKSGVPFPGENIPNWISKYSSITVSITGVGYANSGINEKGLAIGHMGLAVAKYPEKDNRPVLGDTQWIQYMLDNCANSREVIEEAKKIRIVQSGQSGEHYFVADYEGNTAVIEFLDGQMVVHANEDLPYKLLCNDTYEKSMNDLKKYIGFGGEKPVPESVTSIDDSFPIEVMTIGCAKLIEFYTKGSSNIVQEGFDILGAMKAPDTTLQNKDAGTMYTTVFDLKNRKLYFRTRENQIIREVDFTRFQNDCSVKAKMLNILTTGTGDVTDLFVDYSSEENMNVMLRAFMYEENKPPQQMLDMYQLYVDSFECAAH